MQRFTPLALSLIALIATLACTSPAPAPTGTPPTPGGGEPTVKRLVFAVPGAGSGAETNRGDQIGSPDSWLIRPMYEHLVHTDPATGKYIAGLATEWKLAADGKAIGFKLRQGAQFHRDMGEYTAEDAVHSLDVQLASESTSTNKTYFSGAKALGKYEVEYTLPQPLAIWLYTVSQENTVFQQSKAYVEKNGLPKSVADPAVPGTSPFQWKEWVQGSRMVFERAPFQHWSVTPDFPELEFRVQKEASTRLAALLTGEVHMAQLAEDLQGQAIKGGMAIIKGTQPAQRAWLRFHGLYVDNRNPGQWLYPGSPLMDVKVRKALNKAINREELNKAFFGGKGEAMINGPFHANREGWNAGWEREYKDAYGFDTRAAQALLTEAGYSSARPFEANVVLSTSSTVSSAEDMQEAIAGFWCQAGVKVNILSMDPAQRIATDRDLKFDNHISLATSNSDVFVGVQVYNSSIPPRFGAESHATDALFQRVRSEVEQEKRQPLWRELGDLLYNGYMNIPLFWLPTEVVVNPKVVAGFSFPGNITGTWTHLDRIKAAR